MPEPVRTDPVDPAPLSEADRAARIEQLLLSGLDHYFGGDYEQAVNVWTRVAFLERGHGRARAYIERARSAMAERQRESDEFTHNGLAAYRAGNLDVARDLLTRAVNSGGANDTALLFLNRLEAASGAAHGTVAPEASAGRPGASRARSRWLATLAASTLAALVICTGALKTASWLRESTVPARGGDPAPAERLPVVRDAEMRLARARQMYAAGNWRGALRELEAVEPGDVMRPEADRLETDIQHAVLAAAPGRAAAAARVTR